MVGLLKNERACVMKIGYICGMVAAVTSLISYTISVLSIDVFGVNLLSMLGIAGKLCNHLLSLISCLGLLVFFTTGLMECNHRKRESVRVRKCCVRLTRADFWSRVKWVYAIELFIAFPMALLVFAWHKSLIIYSFWETTPRWCVAISVFGLVLIVVLKIAILPTVIRRFYDCNLPRWLVLLLFLFSFLPNVWWLSSLVTVMIAGFVDGTHGANRYGEDPRLRSCLDICE